MGEKIKEHRVNVYVFLLELQNDRPINGWFCRGDLCTGIGTPATHTR